MTAQHAALFENEADELIGGGTAQVFQRLAPDEIAVAGFEGHRPRESRLQRMMMLVHVVAVEIHAGFQPQRVSRTQPRGLNSLGTQRIPCLCGFIGRQHHLETILAGVAGPRDEPRIEGCGAEWRQFAGADALWGRQQRQSLLTGIRALNGDHGQILVQSDGYGEICRMPANPRQILVARAGVHDHSKPGVRDEIDDQIVDHAAAGQQHAGIQSLARDRQPADIVGEHAPQKIAHPVSREVDDAHMRYVEHARIAAHGVMFFDLRTIVQRHFPAAEIDDFCTLKNMGVMERSFKAHRNLAAKV